LAFAGQDTKKNKMKKAILLLFLTLFILKVTHAQVTNGLQVSGNKHDLVNAATGQPVFLLATTVWNINALTYPEIDTLLQSVSGNGFNAIMFALDFYPQADEPNIYGEKAYIGREKTDLNPTYFRYCDHIVDQCTRYGIYPMIYTMWSGKTSGIMNTYTPEQLYTLGKRIGARYREHQNVILVAGGESSPPYIDTIPVNAMGRGLKEGSEGHNLVSVHPCSPHSNSEFYARSGWLDFYMSQAKSNMSGLTFDLTKAVSKDYALTLQKPTMVAEHRYESGATEDPVIQRRSLYLSVFAGGFGYAYGHNALWQMTPHTAQAWMLKSWKSGVADWKQALNTPAQQQLQYIKKLLYAFPYLTRVPDQSLLLTAQADSIQNKVEMMRDGNIGKNDATYIMAYLSSARAVAIDTKVIPAEKLDAWWFDPRTGTAEMIAKAMKNTGSFQSDKKTDGPDWVLVISNAAKNYAFKKP
jgi:hypothetical protein